MTAEQSMSEVYQHSNTKYRLTLKKTARGFYRAYAEVKFSSHMEIIDFSECMPELWGPKSKVMKIKSGATYATNPANIAHQYLYGLIEAREDQIENLSQWGAGKIFTRHDEQGIKMLQKAIKTSKEDNS